MICSNCHEEFDILSDGLCEECYIYSLDIKKELDKRDEYIIVTREMAKDAGDLRLEGQLWKW